MHEVRRGARARGRGLLSGLLFEVGARDPRVFVAVAVTLSAVALAAARIPARRATQVSPLTALREP
ncbi:MAG: hypothetical protein Q8L86_05495 [Vicinamibacterales bacterium]|nr:hypothetical protein [Vicinamibacterales bacterium]